MGAHMARSPGWMVVFAMAMPLAPATSCLAAEPRVRTATATESAAAASLKAAQAEHDRLQAWQKQALAFGMADARQLAGVRAARAELLRLARRLTEADSAAWSAARASPLAGDLDRLLAEGVSEIDAAAQRGVVEPAAAGRLQELQRQVRSGIAAFELAAPARPSQAAWEGQREGLFAAIRTQDTSLAALEAAWTDLQHLLQVRIAQAGIEMDGLQRMIRLLQPPALPASAARSAP